MDFQKIKITFGKRLKEERLAKKMTIKQCSQMLGVSVATWCKWENGKFMPMTNHALKLIRIFQVNIDYLLGFQDEK